MEDDVGLYVEQFNLYVDNTDESRRLCERDRDYTDHKQWTSAESQILLNRGQAPVVMNRIKPKIEFMLGLERQQRTDPKAFPRTPKHDKDAEAITDALRYVADNDDFDQTASDCFDELIVEGTEAAIVEVEKNPRGEYEINVRQVPWDRFYYDPHSRRRDFSDAGFMGITTWVGLDKAKKMWPKMADELDALGDRMTLTDETFEDRPKWMDKRKRRLRINEHYFQKDGIWHLVYFTDQLTLEKPRPSPYKDEHGEPGNPIEAASLYVDRDNHRYGVVRGLIHPQDEINHRRSKALHMLSTKGIIADPGVLKSTADTLKKLRTGSYVIQKENQGELQVIDNADMGQAQLVMLQEAKGEIDAQGPNEALAGSGPSESGRAIQARQAGGSIELTPVYDIHRAWKRRIYRQIWYRIKQFWDEEKWVRVTDDENNVKFAGLNQKVTLRQQIAEQAGADPAQAEMILAQMGATALPGALDQVVEQRAMVSEIDVDIVVQESPNVVNIQQEQFSEIVSLAQVYGPQYVPFDAVLKLSSLRNKDQIIEQLQGNTPEAQAAMQAQQQQAQMEAEKTMAGIKKDNAQALKATMDAAQTQVETQLALFGQEAIG